MHMQKTVVRVMAALLVLLMVLTLAVHLISNIRPVLITFGIPGLRKKTGHILFALAVLLLFMAAALIVYYIRWNRI